MIVLHPRPTWRSTNGRWPTILWLTFTIKMVEILGVVIVLFVVIVFIGLLRITYNVAKGGVDIMEFFGNAGRAGTKRELRNNETNQRNTSSKKRWSSDGRLK